MKMKNIRLEPHAKIEELFLKPFSLKQNRKGCSSFTLKEQSVLPRALGMNKVSFSFKFLYLSKFLKVSKIVDKLEVDIHR